MGRSEGVTTVEQGVYPVPDIPVKDLLGAIPYVAVLPPGISPYSIIVRAHCFKRSAVRSSSYL